MSEYRLEHIQCIKGEPSKPEIWKFSTQNTAWKVAIQYAEYVSEVIGKQYEKLEILSNVVSKKYIELNFASPTIMDDTLNETHFFKIKKD